jgi:D-alanine transaminase
VHIEDRGYQLADAVYEVWSVFGGKLADAAGHFARLWRSLDELKIAPPMSRGGADHGAARADPAQQGIRGPGLSAGLAGVARRDHAFPQIPCAPAVVATAKPRQPRRRRRPRRPRASVITTPENRWGRCDIKTVGLLPNALAKQAAKERGAVEAWFVDELGLVTEGAVVQRLDRRRRRTPAHPRHQANILRGITRSSLLEVIVEAGLPVASSRSRWRRRKAAKEAFITGAGTLVLPDRASTAYKSAMESPDRWRRGFGAAISSAQRRNLDLKSRFPKRTFFADWSYQPAKNALV